MRKKVVAVAPYKREGIVNFKYPPFKAWRELGGMVAREHYPPLRPLVGWLHNHELPAWRCSKREARLRFMEPINRKFDAFPDYTRYEIIPMIWDCWPCLDNRMGSWMEKHHVRTAIFTSRQNAERMQRRFPNMGILVITEGVEVDLYPPGKELAARTIDVLEFGRSNRTVVDEASFAGMAHLCTSDVRPRLTDDQLTETMGNAKATITLTRLDTDPHIAAGVDTLTQRYWECMLARTVMVGRAPQELVDLIGYNPCVNVGKGESYRLVMQRILAHPADYQPLVDRNRATALRLGDWTLRMRQVMAWLEGLGYSVR